MSAGKEVGSTVETRKIRIPYTPGSAGTLKTLRIPDYSDATVYLPFGYEKGELYYPTFYLLHGGGGDEHSFFSEDGILKNGQNEPFFEHI